MSGYSFVGSSGGAASPANPNYVTEAIGFGADGTLTAVTAGAAHVKGTYVTIGTTTNALSGLDIELGDANTTARFLLDIRIGGATVIVPDLLMQPGSNIAGGRMSLPLVIPTGTLIEARCQSSTASAILRIALSGRITDAASPPCFSTCTALNIDTATTQPAATAIPLAATLGSYTQLVAATGGTYGALMAVGSTNNVAMLTAQQVTFLIGYGAAASEVVLRRMSGHIGTSQPYMPRIYRLIEQAVPSGSRLAAAALAPTPGTENVRCALYGFA